MPAPRKDGREEDWAGLSHTWRAKIRDNTVWSGCEEFYDYVKAHRFTKFCSLARLDPTKPWGPSNCKVEQNPKSKKYLDEQERELINRWNRTVNKIRAAYGLPLFEVSDDD